MAKRIKIRVFNTLESNNLMVSGWYSCKNNNSKRYGLFTGTTEGLDNERQVYCKEFMKPNVKIVSTDLWQICIKIRHCDRNLVYEHEYRDWNDDICIGWLRPGNLGDDTVNWFFNGKKDCWYNGGEKGDSLVVSHRVICGNIPPSVGLGNPSSETSTGSEGNGSASGGHYVRPGSEENSSASGGHYVRPGSEGNTSTSGGQYVRPGSEGNGSASGGQYVRPGSEEKASTPGRLYPTGKGSVLQNYMNADGSPKEPDQGLSCTSWYGRQRRHFYTWKALSYGKGFCFAKLHECRRLSKGTRQGLSCTSWYGRQRRHFYTWKALSYGKGFCFAKLYECRRLSKGTRQGLSYTSWYEKYGKR